MISERYKIGRVYLCSVLHMKTFLVVLLSSLTL